MLGMTHKGPGVVDVNLAQFVEAIGADRARVLSKLISDKYGIAQLKVGARQPL